MGAKGDSCCSFKMLRISPVAVLGAAAVLVSLHAGCVHAPARSSTAADPLEAPSGAPSAPEGEAEAPSSEEATDERSVLPASDAPAQARRLADRVAVEQEVDDEGDEGDAADDGELEDAGLSAELDERRYTADLSDEELEALWRADPAKLGSISVGFAHQGRVINAQQFPRGEQWLVVDPAKTWATEETVAYLVAAIGRVRELHPDAPPLRVNQMSGPEGGYLRPHKSHQSGRDVDLAFYYPTVQVIRVRERERVINPELNWALVKALITHTDVQLILVDKRIQKVLYDHALAAGEDKAWLDSLFGPQAIIRHARRHRDHFHVRFYSPRAQELGRRLAPLMKDRPEQNVVMHRVKYGDTLGGIAARYGTSIDLLRRSNNLRGSFIQVGQVLQVRMKGPCTRCPVPPPVVVPKRRLPPDMAAPEPLASR
jgi:murein endopeptidase